MTAQSAGILLYRHRDHELQVLLVHPGGPYWAHKDEGAWSIPKGEYASGEEPLHAAQREFLEELGAPVSGPFLALQSIRQRSGKLVCAWAASGEFDPSQLRSNEFEMEWPPRSGRRQRFPEVDRAAWFSLAPARVKMAAAQVPFLDRLLAGLRVEAL
jgi:predicted NUDIX family NTP pyrophosphohydrolase